MRTPPTSTPFRRRVVAAGCLTMLAAAGCRPTYPACDGDGDCLNGEFCVLERCQACRDTADCAAGERCVEGRCEGVPDTAGCAGDADCGPGEACVGSRCRPAREGARTSDSGSKDCRLEPIRFAFDDATLDQRSRDRLEATVRCLRDRGIGRVDLVGHADPRGTEEYNLALGERRARTVRSYLASLGMPEASMTARSMGEELAAGTDEAGWARDRRVDVVDADGEDGAGGQALP